MRILTQAVALAAILAGPVLVRAQNPTLIGSLSRPVISTGALHVTRVNAGGPVFTDSSGRVWAADTNTTALFFGIPATPIADTVDDTLFLTESYGEPTMAYTFTVPNGLYTVRLRFAEIYLTTVGERVFHVDINGARVESNFDIMAFGNFRAIDRTYQNVNVTGGAIALTFTGVVDNGKVSAIEIIQTSAPGGASTTRLLSQYPTVAANGCVGGDVTARVAAALAALPNGETLIFDCMADISGAAISTGKTNITLDASAGGGVRFIGNPAQNAEIFGVASCTNCAVKHLTINANGRQAIPFSARTSTGLTFESNTITNPSPLAVAAVFARGGTNNRFLDNTLTGLAPTFVSGSTTAVQALGPIGFSIGDSSGEENGAEVARNIATSSGNTFIDFGGSAGSIHHNTGTNLIAEGVKVSTSGAGGSTVIEDNTFRGSLSGWTLAGVPLNGGNLAMSAGSSADQFIIRNNTIDGGKNGIAFTGSTGSADVHHNYLINQWDTAVLFTLNSTVGTVRVHHNWIGHPRAVVVQGNDLVAAVRLLAASAITLQNITVDTNYITGAQYGVQWQSTHASAVITATNVNSNSFVALRSEALRIEQTTGTIATPTLTPANCYSGNNGGGNAVSDSRSILTQPTQVASCTNPTGLTAP